MLLTLWAADVLRSWYEREIALEIGGTYEEMLKRSSARFSLPFPGEGTWPGWPKSDAQLRFIDPQYGFVTPKSSDFYVIFNDNIIQSLTIYPQTEPLLLDDALQVVLDLQDQWRRGGWEDKKQKRFPPFADTPQWRAQLRNGPIGGTTYWYAGDKYQALLAMNRSKDSKHPEEERYRIFLNVGKPWTPYP
ncbi:hypothetical protein QN382_05735 [Pseudomonas sp. 10B1]|nr:MULTISPECIES: hypothetical protein [unclassified Pseudomonas]MEB0125418.1 hypothetical protein [Pseudomonas sp. CCC1.2]MDY7562942.1 hypothetical protein [Pseudomonas sp. AB6]MEA9978639.1 hypothetical protein [Pseudomonas sp. RTS4]MEA9995471.1 hypothetical protein [Pseudomonas sp. AA4]MEB0085315.1 hypothetical protein [Pseudomonas sp. RTI1]